MEEMCLTVARLDLGSFTLLSIPRQQQFRGSYQFEPGLAELLEVAVPWGRSGFILTCSLGLLDVREE